MAYKVTHLSHTVQWHPRFRVWVQPMLVKMCASTWSKSAQVQCLLPKGQQVLHQRWIWGIYCTQATKHASKGSSLALKPWADITRGIGGPTKRTNVLQKLKIKHCCQWFWHKKSVPYTWVLLVTKLVVRGNLVYLNISSGSLWVQDTPSISALTFI